VPLPRYARNDVQQMFYKTFYTLFTSALREQGRMPHSFVSSLKRLSKMKRILVVAGVLVILLASAFTYYKITARKVNEDYSVNKNGYAVNKDGYSVKVFRNAQGPIYFKGLITDIVFDEAHPESSRFVASIDASTVDTGNELMTAHAKEPEVLDTEKFPIIIFESTSVRKAAVGYEVTGKLKLKGITKEITFPFTFENETFSGNFSILAKDFNITRNGAVPSGEIKIELTIPVKR
jgi:polyisoprenoid-binding protein YceI